MKTLDTGQEKIAKICHALRQETLEPAKQEAEAIILEARQKAEEILADAHEKAKQLVQETEKKLQQEKNVVESSLAQAAKQTLESLRQSIEEHFFNQELHTLVTAELQKPNIIASLVNTLVTAIEKDGIQANLQAIIPEKVPAEEVNKLLLKDVLSKLANQSVELGTISGGAQIKLDKGRKQITLDLSDAAIEELLSRYLRKDFRERLFYA